MPINPNPTPTPPYQSDNKYDPRTQVPESPYSTSANQKKSGCGCWFYGCFSIILIFAGFLFAIYFGVKHFAGKIESLSSTQPISSQFGGENLTAADYDKVMKKVEGFLLTLATAKGIPEISLNENEINSIISHHPTMLEVRNKVRVEIPNDLIVTKISLPLDEFKMAGKFINVRAEWKLQMMNDVLTLNVKNIQLADMKLPEVLSKEIEAANIGQEIMDDPENKQKLSVIEKIIVSQGKLIISIKKGALPLKFDEAPAQKLST